MAKNKKTIFIVESPLNSPGALYVGGMGSGKSSILTSQIPGYSDDLIESTQFKYFIETGKILSKKEAILQLKSNGISKNIIVSPEEYDLYKDDND